MSNVLNNKFNQIDLRLSKSDYWDFALSKENDPSIIYDGEFLYDDTLISCVDINNSECCTGDTILYSSSGYTWPDATGYTQDLILANIGFTGIDNGLITDISIDGITGSTLIRTGDTRLILYKITGNTNDYIYPTQYVKRNDFNYIKLDGGFYQGFFKSGDNYCILPDKIKSEMGFEVMLKPVIPFTVVENTLNAKYPNNKGFFLYIGNRSENKFWYNYIRNDTDKYEISKTGQTSTIVSENTLNTNDGFSIYNQNSYDIETDNKYILFNRTSYGYNADNFDETATYLLTGNTQENINLFEYFNRTNTGYTVNTYNQISGTSKPYDVIQDVIGNGIGFRLKEDSETGNTCSIGYRVILPSCEENEDYIVQEEYSASGLIRNDEIAFINIRLIFNSFSECPNGDRKFKIYIYLNGNLVLVSKELPELLFRKLNDTDEKQEGVAYNISLGGGSQGLGDVIGFNTGYTTQYLLPIEKHFAGTFIGCIYKFGIYEGKMDYTKIMNNCLFTKKVKPFHVDPTAFFILSGNTLAPETTFKREFGNNLSYLNLSATVNSTYYPLTKYEINYYNSLGIKTPVTGSTLNSLGGVILENYEHFTNNSSSITYESLIYDSMTNEYVNRNTINIEYDHMIFYGTAKAIPANSTDIRALNNKIFAKGTKTFIINTESTDKIFVFAIPDYMYLNKVEDEIMNNVISLDITNLFNESLFDVNDGGGFATPYKIYVMTNAIPYSSNHPLLVTLNETSDDPIYIAPKFLYFATTNDSTVEVGTKLPDSLIFNFNISKIENVKQNSMSILDVTNSNMPIISNQPVTSPVSAEIGDVKYTTNGAMRAWRGRAEDENDILFNSSIYTVVWRLKTFFGSIDEFPNDSASIRLLSNYTWDDINTFNINIDNLKYTIAVRNGKTIKSIITDNEEDITSNFILRPQQMIVYLADNVTTELYNVYDFEIVTPINGGLGATVTLM